MLELGEFQQLTTQPSCCGKEDFNGKQIASDRDMNRHWRVSAFQLGLACQKRDFISLDRKKEGDRNFKKSLDGIKKYEYVCTRTHVRQLLGVSVPGALPC